MTQTTDPGYLGAREACEALGIDRSTLSRWVASGRITPAMKLPGTRGAFLFNRQDVTRLVSERAA